MKTVTAIIVLLVILVGGYYVIRMADTTDGTDTTDEGRVRGPESASFKVGETKSVGGLSVTLDAIKADSRCPVDVTCVQAGELLATVTLQSRDDLGTSMDVSSNKEPIEFDGYAVSITAVSPEANSKVILTEADYAVTLRVAPMAEGENI